MSAVVFNPRDTLIGVALTALGIPVYLRIRKGQKG
jgi:hypothetical protein